MKLLQLITHIKVQVKFEGQWPWPSFKVTRFKSLWNSCAISKELVKLGSWNFYSWSPISRSRSSSKDSDLDLISRSPGSNISLTLQSTCEERHWLGSQNFDTLSHASRSRSSFLGHWLWPNFKVTRVIGHQGQIVRPRGFKAIAVMLVFWNENSFLYSNLKSTCSIGIRVFFQRYNWLQTWLTVQVNSMYQE